MRNLRVAGSFLTRVPLHVDGEIDLPAATPWFPIVGLFVGAAGAGAFAGAGELLPPAPSAALALVVTALITGAFHHDGLADIADAFGGGWNVEQRRAILRDPRHGTYGVVSLVLVILVQWSALTGLRQAVGVAALVAAHVLGRAAILGTLLFGRPAAGDGLGADHSAGLRRPATAAGLVVGTVIGGVVLGVGALVAVPLVALAALVVNALARRKIGGFSGDVLGATELIGESTVLLSVAAFAHHGHLPWWT